MEVGTECISQRDIQIPKATIDTLLKTGKDFLAVTGLYTFYYYTAIWQKTNQPKVTTKYAAKGCHISVGKVQRLKKILMKLNLIKDIVIKNEQGQITGHFIKVRFYRNQSIEKPVTGKSHDREKRGTNAYSNGKLNAYSNNIVGDKRTISNKKDFLLSGKLNNTPKQNQFDVNCVKRLYKNLQKKRKIMRKPNFNNWAKEFQKLREVVERERLKDVLGWYVNNIQNPFVPQAFSAGTFCNRFIDIESAMERDRKKNGEGDNQKIVTEYYINDKGQKIKKVHIE